MVLAGKSVREAKTLLQFHMLVEQKTLDKRIIDQQREELCKVTKKESFVEQGMLAHSQQKSNWEQQPLWPMLRPQSAYRKRRRRSGQTHLPALQLESWV